MHAPTSPLYPFESQSTLGDGPESRGCGIEREAGGCTFWRRREASKELVKDPNIASHLQLDLDENGQPKQLRFVYVDEAECIGCTMC